MKFKPEAITEFLNNRAGMSAMWVLAILGSYIAMSSGSILQFVGDGGLAFPSANNWIEPGWGDWLVATVTNIGIALLAVAVNRTYNVLRNMTMLFGGLYAVISLATPSIFGQLYGGTVVCLMLLLCQFLLYSMYGHPDNTRRTFLIFFLLALTALVAKVAIYFIPILVLGCIQMRVLNLRNVSALVIGIITPAWILMGLGIIPLDGFAWPHLTYSIPELFKGGMLPMIVSVVITMIIAIIATITNLYRTLSYNSRSRAYNGFIAITLFLTLLLMLIDYNDFLVYVPILNILTAIQLAHLFVWQPAKIGYIPVLVTVVGYLALFIWNL